MATPEQVKRRGRLSLILGAIVATVLFAAVAYADNVVNDVSTASKIVTVTAGGPGATVNYWIVANNGDGQTGCNAADTSSATVTPTGLPPGVAKSPTSLTFTSCGTGAAQGITYTAGASTTPADYPISVSVSDSGTGSYNTNPGAITLRVLAPPDSTPPVITSNVSGTPGNTPWYVSNVTVTWSVVDNESAISSSSGCDSTTISSDTAGTTLTCTATSGGGTSSESVTIKRDASAPTISASASPAANLHGWNNTDVTVSYSCSDNGPSGVDAAASDLASDLLTASGTASGTCKDNAGNSASASYEAKIDKVKPVITGSRTPAANTHGWNNTDVVVSFTCTDAGGSDIDTNSVAGDTVSSEAANQSVTNTGSCTDKAGNTAESATVSGISIDKTAPSVSLVGGPANGGSYYFGSVPAAPTCSASDSLSGLDGSCSVSGYSAAVGTHTVSASASDKAGNVGSDSHTYTVLAWTLSGFYQPVDMGSSVVNTVKNGSTVPLKFEVFAGPTELTDPANVQSLTQQLVNCTTFAGDAADEIEATATGGTSLRYDTTAGQFVYNWKTPAKANTCYVVKMTTDDGSSLTAQFKLR
jgi:hypothetical protein